MMIGSGKNGDDLSVGRVSQVKKPAEVGEATGADAVEAVEVVDASGTEAIVEALRSGEITPAQAQERLIDQVVAAQLGPNAPEALVEEVRAQVTELLRNDPTLQALLRP
jgi:hypothetical protein